MAQQQQNLEKIPEIVSTLRDSFNTGVTKTREWRLHHLQAMRRMMEEGKQRLCQGMKQDVGKSELEGYLCENNLVENELQHVIDHLDEWMKPDIRTTNLLNLPASSYVQSEPYGVALIMGAWNYPVMLSLAPLVGCIAAGNCAVVKVPSPKYSPASSKAMEELMAEYMDPHFFVCVGGDRHANTALLEQRWNLIFCTGSASTGKIVATAAAKHLTPILLELGGKNPCIVDQTACLKLASKRIVWGSFMNCGQTCVRPEYVLVHENVADQFVSAAKQQVEEMYSTQPQKSEWFGRVATDWAWERITGYITEEKGHVVHGGDADRDDKFVAPTILYYEDMPTFVASAVAKEEIFGPVMVVIKYGDLDGVLQYINGKEKPLALYFFGSDRRVREKVLTGTTSGSVCVNDVIMQIINPELPFGGVGHSGMGHYHGKYSFDAFSHQKAVMVKPNVNILDPPIRYPPYTPFKATVLPFVQAASWLSYLPQGLALVLAFLALVLQLGFFKRRIDGALSVVQAYL